MKDEVDGKNLHHGAGFFYTMLSLVATSGIAFCFYLLLSGSYSSWIHLLEIAFALACFTIQLEFIGHAGGHRQLSSKPKVNDRVGLLFTPLVAISQSMWRHEHNKHHGAPNDPAIDLAPRLPLFSFSVEQFLARHPAIQWITRFQAFYFPFLAAVETWGLHITSLIYIYRNRRDRLARLEGLAILAYVVIYATVLIVSPLAWWEEIAFFVVHKWMLGLYMGMVFAPNHKGMEIIERSADVSFLMRQLLTTRNAGFGGLIVTIIFGGLDLQIEHHLFQHIPYHRLGEVRKIVKRYAREYNLPYHEVPVLISFWEFLVHLFHVGQTKMVQEVA